MKSLLTDIKPTDIELYPFPHLVIENAMAQEDYRLLSNNFPPFDLFALEQKPENRDIGNNKRFNYWTKNILSTPEIHPAWKDFSRIHTSKSFFADFLRLFKTHILTMHPTIEQKLGLLENLKVGLRKVDPFTEVDIVLAARAEINTPVLNKPSSVRRVHTDLPDKLYVGILYMRQEDDDSTGGNLEFYRFRHDLPNGLEIPLDNVPEEYVEVAKTIKYKPNTFVIWPNNVNALHGVTMRGVTSAFRRYAFLSGEFQHYLNENYKRT